MRARFQLFRTAKTSASKAAKDLFYPPLGFQARSFVIRVEAP